MKIKAILKKNKSSNCIVVNENDETFEISLDLLVKFALKKNSEISDETYSLILHEQSIIKAKQAAYNYASFKPRTEFQIREKLNQLGFDKSVSDITVSFLYEFNLLDDEQFAKTYIESYLLRKSAGEKKLYFELIKKGIDKNTAQKAINELFPQIDKSELIRKAAQKKLKLISNKSSDKQKSSLISYLQRQGFDWNNIKNTVDEIFKKK